MTEVHIVLDYKNNFYSSELCQPYRSGMDKEALSRFFREHNCDVTYLRYDEINFREMNFNNKVVLYQSSEDFDLYYKSFIEDIVLGLQLQGAILIPDFYLFRAHHNKVFMEILRDVMASDEVKNIRSRYFGTLEEFRRHVVTSENRLVIKPAEGAMSTGVRLATSQSDKLRSAAGVSATPQLARDAKDFLRAIRRKGYVRESRHRRKFVAQNFIENLGHDWKVVIYGRKFYVLLRRTRGADFRASGSGLFEFTEDIPHDMLDFSRKIFDQFDEPYLSLDIGFNGSEYFLFEFQAVHFGNKTIQYSPFYFVNEDEEWRVIKGKSVLEEEFARSVAAYIGRLELGDA